MADYLTPEWITALDAALRNATELGAATTAEAVVIEHHVTGAPGGTIVYHVTLGGERVGAAAGPAVTPTVTFRQDYETARAIATGSESAQSAFVRGGLLVEGDVQGITELGTALGSLADVLRDLRADTVF